MRKFILLLIPIVTASCSAMDAAKLANTQNILIETPNIEGAECEVTDAKGRKWRLWETPGTVAVQQGHPPLNIICTKSEFKKSILSIDEHKKELLTIDGEHIDVSPYNQFATKFPRLIPGVLNEAASFVQDPTASLSTQYPQKAVVFMEPKRWESEEQMREWAFYREFEDNSQYIEQQNAKAKDDARKVQRRAENKEREEKRDQLIKETKEALDPRPYMIRGYKNTAKIINPRDIANWMQRKGEEFNPPAQGEGEGAEPAAGISPHQKKEWKHNWQPSAKPIRSNIPGNNKPKEVVKNKPDEQKPEPAKIKYDANGNRIAPWK